MYQYRVTKYDPQYRDSSGAFRRDDWTAVSDVDLTFNGVKLTPQRYVAVENAYVESALAFLTESRVETLTIDSLENHRGYSDSDLMLADGRVCSLLEIADVARLNLRSSIWCRLVGSDAFLHFGYDYYMYVGVPIECPASIDFATRSGLFVEPFESPYLE